MNSTPLNPHLFGRLQAIFGRVTIADAGSAQRGAVTLDAELKAKWNVISPGEYYRIACPYCCQVGGSDSDVKQRLWINYAWGVIEPQTQSRRWFLAHCFNENCLSSDRAAKGFDNLRDLRQRVYSGLPHELQLPTINQPATAERAEEPATLPLGGYVWLEQLPDSHPAIAYVRGRCFDPATLSRWWNVGYCQWGPASVGGKLVIPVYHRGEQRSWQARLCFDPPPFGPIKYWSGPRIHRWIYGFDQALASRGPIVVVEGVTSVWRLGPGAVAVFGKTVNGQQQEYIEQAARAHLQRTLNGELGAIRPVVIALDGKSERGATTASNAWRLAANLAQREVRATVVELPDGTQPDGLSLGGQFWPLVHAAAAAQGMSLLT